jgi:uncharacterized protein (DUF4415 family)
MAAKRKVKPEMIDDENPEWTAEDFARARPGVEVLPAPFLKKWRNGNHKIVHESDAEYEANKRRGLQKAPTKERITIRLSRDVVSLFRASGTGWQGRVDSALRDWLKRHSPNKGG